VIKSCLTRFGLLSLPTYLFHFQQINAFLKTINLDFEELVPVEFDATWMAALKSNRSLTSLRFNRLMLNDAGAKAISAFLMTKQSCLTDLCFSHNSLGKSGVLQLYQALKTNSTLQSLNLLHNAVMDYSEEDVEESAKIVTRHPTLDTVAGLKKAQLQGSVFEAHGLDEFHVCLWSVLLRSATSVTKLDLASNGIGASGASAEPSTHACMGTTYLARLLAANSSITTLILDRNPLSGMDISPVLNHIKRKSRQVSSLSLCDTRLDAKCARHIAESIYTGDQLWLSKGVNKTLFSLTLDDNPFMSDDGVAALASVLSIPGLGLQELSLRNVGATQFQPLIEALPGNKSLQRICCDDVLVADSLAILQALPFMRRLFNRLWIRMRRFWLTALLLSILVLLFLIPGVDVTAQAPGDAKALGVILLLLSFCLLFGFFRAFEDG
jgi:hypothetical protein